MYAESHLTLLWERKYRNAIFCMSCIESVSLIAIVLTDWPDTSCDIVTNDFTRLRDGGIGIGHTDKNLTADIPLDK